MEHNTKENILSNLSDAQKSVVVDTENNLYVTACPGSGKTRTLTRKIAYTSNLYPDSLKKIIAITYTNRAANEIVERLEKLDVNEEHIWVGTIHQFCLDFILRKYGLNLSRTSRGIKIIDEYTTSKYLKLGCEELRISYNHYDHPNLKLNTSEELFEKDRTKINLAKNYHHRLSEKNEIDFDLILTLSLKILEENPVATEIISKNMRSIFIDEFQDTNEYQYQVIGLLAKANNIIKLMFVGDSDQAIFTSLGGVVKSKTEIEDVTGLKFIEKTLDGCYRSTQRIVDLYSQFQQEEYTINSLAEHKLKRGTVIYDKETHKDNLPIRISEIITKSLQSGYGEKDICIVAPNQFILSPVAKELKVILPDVNFRSQDIYPIKPDDLNLFYKISYLVFTPIGKRMRLRKKIANEILQYLRDDYNVNIDSKFISIDFLDLLNKAKSEEEDGLKFLDEKIKFIFKELGISKTEHYELFTQMDDFFNKAEERISDKRLKLNRDIENFRNIYKEKSGISISTIHKTKGEEYDVVIAFGFLEDIVPFFKSENKIVESKKLLYVTISRAKKDVYLFSERGRETNGYPPKLPTKVLAKANVF
ncbi:ATP-dependent helicase [Vagococcus carniphilus]|uniref:ATP-dependent helicase n=1 Tax=Vagococcus carniphilus TaxID=218144 RepID=UPI0028906F58|nr:ATP-dependent helicase [Vagococcus carniphilus]MDT2864349.1 ATP-dependent helicase [Vagococcus carniphilus]